jgi:hypothetical protein
MRLNVKSLFSLSRDKILSCWQNKCNLHLFILQLAHYISFLLKWSLQSFEKENAIIMSLVLNYRYFRKNVFFSHLISWFTLLNLSYLSFFFFCFFYRLLRSSCCSHYLFWFSCCSHYLSQISSFSHYLLWISLYYFYIIVLVSLYFC